MALNSYLTLRAPIEIDYSATTSAGFSMSKGTSKFKVASGIPRYFVWPGGLGLVTRIADSAGNESRS